MRSTAKKFDHETTQRCRDWLYGYMRKFGRELEPHPPDPLIVAQFLSVAPWPQLESLLNKLVRENCEAGKTYAWFVAVALQRIHGINPAQLRERRAALQLVRTPPPPAAEQAALDPTIPTALELQSELRAMAKTKGMR